MSSVLSDDDDRLIKITAKRSETATSGLRPRSKNGLGRKAPKKKVPLKAVSGREKMKKKVPKKVKKSGKGSLTTSDASGIKTKAELGDNLQTKKIVNNPPMESKGVSGGRRPPERYTRIAGMPEESTIEPLAVELERDQDLYLSEQKPILNDFGQFSMSHNLSQGIIWNDI